MKLSDYNGTTPSDDGRVRCPQCQEMLEIVDRATVVGYGCPSCGGIWLDSVTTLRVEATLDTQTIQVGEVASSLSQNPTPPHEASPPCPLCANPMRSYVVLGSDVEVDTCDAHGTWFDRGELQTLIRELMRRLETDPVMTNAPLPLVDVKAKMLATYGVDPTLTPGHLWPVLKEILDAWEILTEGRVLPGNRD
ncbi:MAG: zf-TFIIB domain-containing protein [Polyangiaceae bacterium]